MYYDHGVKTRLKLFLQNKLCKLNKILIKTFAKLSLGWPVEKLCRFAVIDDQPPEVDIISMNKNFVYVSPQILRS